MNLISERQAKLFQTLGHSTYISDTTEEVRRFQTLRIEEDQTGYYFNTTCHPQNRVDI